MKSYQISYKTPEGKTITTGNFASKRAAQNAAVRQTYDASTPWLRNQNASAVSMVKAD